MNPMKPETIHRFREVKRLRQRGHCFKEIGKRLKISPARAALIFNLGRRIYAER